MKKYLTIDVGGTYIKYGVIDQKNKIIFKDRTNTNAHLGALEIIESIKQIHQTVANKFQINGVAISTTGVIDDLGNSLINPPAIKDWDTINFNNTLKVLHHDIAVLNDVNSVALSEAHTIYNKDVKSMFVMTVGTGIGGALLFNNELYKGESFSAGEIGKMIIDTKNMKTYEQLASVDALVDDARLVDSSVNNGIDVFKLYDLGNEAIIKVVNNFYNNLATGIINVIYLLNPEVIVIGGGITNRGEKFIHELKNQIDNLIDPYFKDSYQIRVPVKGDNSALIGAFINYKNTYGI